MWSHNDTTGRTLQAIAGTTAAVSTMTLLMAICALLPVTDLVDSRYQTWQKIPITSLPNFVQALQSNSPELYAEILAVASLSGMTANLKLREAWARLQGTFGGAVHSAFLQAIMIFIWASTASPRSATVLATLAEYLVTDHAGLTGFQLRCRDPSSAPSTFVDLSASFLLSSIQSTAGFRRLNPDEPGNEDLWAEHWLFMWTCVCDVVQHSTERNTVEDALQLLSPSVFEAQAETESCRDFFSRISMAHATAKASLDKLQCPHLLPHKDSLVPLVFAKARRKLSLQVKTLLATSDPVEPHKLHLDKAVELYYKAEKRTSVVHPSLDAALNATKPPAKDKKPVKAPAPTGSPAGAVAAPAQRAALPIRHQTFTPNPQKEASEATVANWKEQGACLNCGGDHRTGQCPHERRDGKPWTRRGRTQTPGVFNAAKVRSLLPRNRYPDGSAASRLSRAERSLQ